MDKVKVIFGKGESMISNIILFVTRSEWSHVAYIDPVSGYIIEASGGKGVIASTYDSFKIRYPVTKIAEIPVKNAEQFRVTMISLLGSDYDFSAILGYLLRKDWNEHDKWMCSEAIAHASGLFRPDKIHRVTQEMVYMISENSDFDFSKYYTVDINPSMLNLLGFY